MARGFEPAHHVVPDLHVVVRGDEFEVIDDQIVDVFRFQCQREFVDRGLHIHLLDNGFHRHVAKEGELLPHLVVHRLLGAADENIGLNPDFPEFGNALLARLGLQLCGGLQVGEQCAVEEEDVAVADFERELSHRLQKGQALDIPDRATEFGDQHIHIVFAALVNPFFDFVGHVGDDLDGGSEIVAAPFFLNDPLVNLSGGQVVEAAEFARGETLVVPEVEVGLGPVVQDIHLSVLEWAHRARVDVQVWIELLQADLEPTLLKECADRCRGQALSQGGDDTSRDKDVFHAVLLRHNKN